MHLFHLSFKQSMPVIITTNSTGSMGVKQRSVSCCSFLTSNNTLSLVSTGYCFSPPLSWFDSFLVHFFICLLSRPQTLLYGELLLFFRLLNGDFPQIAFFSFPCHFLFQNYWGLEVGRSKENLSLFFKTVASYKGSFEQPKYFSFPFFLLPREKCILWE